MLGYSTDVLHARKTNEIFLKIFEMKYQMHTHDNKYLVFVPSLGLMLKYSFLILQPESITRNINQRSTKFYSYYKILEHNTSDNILEIQIS